MEMFLMFVFVAMSTGAHADDQVTIYPTDVNISSMSYEYETSSDVDFDDQSSGWEWYPLRWSWWLIIQIVSAIIGMLGNGIVIAVIFRRYGEIKSTEVLIGNLAIADFLTSASLIPIPWAKQVPPTVLGHLYCKLLYPNFFLWTFITAATYLLVMICIERLVAVVWPLYFKLVINRLKVSQAAIFTWVFSIALVVYTLFIFIYDDDISYCAVTIHTEAGRTAQAYYAFCIRLVVPVAIMLGTQLIIASQLHRQAREFRDMVQGGTGSHNDGGERGPGETGQSFHIVARNRVIKMMLIVVLVYTLTWTPNQVAYLCFNLGVINQSYRGSPLHRILTVIGFFNSYANPFIYAARNPEFRLAVKDLLKGAQLRKEAVF